MPRKRQTMSGDDAQNIGSVPGQRYGEGVEQQAMQQAMPAPELAGAPAAVPAAPGGDMQRPGADPAMIQQFLAQHKPSLLGQTGRPDEPVSAGLRGGPGPGPEALGMQVGMTPLARTLQRLSVDTGNPMFSRLAERAGL